MDIPSLGLTSSFFTPLFRLLAGLLAGLFLAQILESLRWSQYLTVLSAPLSRYAHLGATSQQAFTLAFISPVSANALLSEAHNVGTLTKKELILSNLFNSFPAYLVHTPTLFLLIWPILGSAALVYVGLSLAAAFMRTFVTLLLARTILPSVSQTTENDTTVRSHFSLSRSLYSAYTKFRRRVPKLLLFTIPVYCLMYYIQTSGLFSAFSTWLASQSFWSEYFSPQVASIVVLHFLAELGSALGACGGLLATGGIKEEEVILALLVGNILSTPVRAIRHQLPSYAGLFSPKLGLELIVHNQLLRALSMTLVTITYVFYIA
ncbi:MAG: hypothetical protein K5657_03080 [Desulfovibrio sp.]|nr:hypothetical protein [Desulfovibrio sp.]